MSKDDDFKPLTATELSGLQNTHKFHVDFQRTPELISEFSSYPQISENSSPHPEQTEQKKPRLSFLKKFLQGNDNEALIVPEGAGAACCVPMSVNEIIAGVSDAGNSAGGGKALVNMPMGASHIAGTAGAAIVAGAAAASAFKNWRLQHKQVNRLKDVESNLSEIRRIHGKSIAGESLTHSIVQRRKVAEFMREVTGKRSFLASGLISVSAIPGLSILAPIGLFGTAYNGFQHVRFERDQIKETTTYLKNIERELRDLPKPASLDDKTALLEQERHFKEKLKLHKKNAWRWGAFSAGAAALGGFSVVGLVAASVASHGALPAAFIAAKIGLLAVGVGCIGIGIDGALRYNNRLYGQEFTPSVPEKTIKEIERAAKEAQKIEKEIDLNKETLVNYKSPQNIFNQYFNECKPENLKSSLIQNRKQRIISQEYQNQSFSKMKVRHKIERAVISKAVSAYPIITLGFGGTSAGRKFKEASTSWFQNTPKERFDAMQKLHMLQNHSINCTSTNETKDDFEKLLLSIQENPQLADGIGKLLAKRVLKDSSESRTIKKNYGNLFFPHANPQNLRFNDEKAGDAWKKIKDPKEREQASDAEYVRSAFSALYDLPACCDGISYAQDIFEFLQKHYCKSSLTPQEADAKRKTNKLVEQAADQYLAYALENESKENTARSAGILAGRQQQGPERVIAPQVIERARKPREIPPIYREEMAKKRRTQNGSRSFER